MGHYTIIIALVVGLSIALVFGYISQRLKLSPLVGYLIAGMVIGPYTPGIEIDLSIVQEFAEIGVVLLMFGVGLHFNLKDLIAVQRVALPGALTQIAVATCLGFGVATLFGFSFGTGILYGMAISVASTVVLTRILSDYKDLQTTNGHTAIGWLIVEDLFTIFVMVLLPIVMDVVNGGANNWAEILQLLGLTFLKIAGLIAFILIFGKKLISVFLSWIARTGTRDLFTLAVLVLALGIALLAGTVFNASMVLGAFLSGMVVGQSKFSARAASEALPMRDAFAVLFFVSVGMLFDPSLLVKNWPFVLATLGIILIGKSLAAFVVVKLLGKPIKLALSVAIALAQVGEFTFILANVGKQYGLIDENIGNALIVSSVVSIGLNSFLYGRIPFMLGKMRKWSLFTSSVDITGTVKEDDSRRCVILVGFGPAGKMVYDILSQNNVRVVVIEMNINTVNELMERGISVIYGDASQSEVLRAAGIDCAESMIISAPGAHAHEIVDAVHILEPKIKVILNTGYLRDALSVNKLKNVKAFSGEFEVASSMASYLLKEFGATEEMIEKERKKFHREYMLNSVKN